MRTLIVYSSKHHMNTEKVAKVIGAELGADIRKLADTTPESLEGFDLVGFGSGINGFNVHPELQTLVTDMPDRTGQQAFVFTTCASRRDWTGRFRKQLADKGFTIVGEFHCAGLWSPGPFRIRRGHPDAADLESARKFARGLMPEFAARPDGQV